MVVQSKKSLPERVMRFAKMMSATWLLFFTLTLVLVVGWVLIFDKINLRDINRPSVQSPKIDVSARTKSQLMQLAQTSAAIKLILITEVDMRSNLRRNRWWFLNDPGTYGIRIEEAARAPLAVFTTDSKNSQQLIGVLSNEFICAPYEDTIYAQSFGTLPPILTLCQLALPLPRFGSLAGILILGLKIVPTPEQQVGLKMEASRIAAELSLRGDIKSP